MQRTLPEGLVEAAQAGDEVALLQLLVACRPDLNRYARRACEADDIEEAVQDALWLLYRRVGAIRTGAALSGWLFQVVQRLCMRFTRKRAARPQPGVLEVDLAGAASDDDLRLDLVRAVGQLPAAYREILILRDVRGLDTAEVAAMLNISGDAAKSRIHRARGLMRDLLRSGTPVGGYHLKRG